MTTTITTASHQWMTRPDDQRFTSLDAMAAYMDYRRQHSRQTVVSTRQIEARPASDDPRNGIEVVGKAGVPYRPTNWAFGQLAGLAEAPAGYLRTLPAPLAADCVNYGLKFKRDITDIGMLLSSMPDTGKSLDAATGPKYGRVWNSDVVHALRKHYGDGISGPFRVPGEFGRAVQVTKSNTTLYASDRDMFVFLADETNRIEVPNRRHGQPGALARGFFVWNSEEGAKTLGIGTFLFDYVCMNRIIWGAQDYAELRVRHTVSAPDRFIEEVAPAIERMAHSSTHTISQAITEARAARLDKVDDFLATRFGKGTVASLQQIHLLEEERPIETLWDVTTAATALARSITHQDERVKLERLAGQIMALGGLSSAKVPLLVN